MSLARRRSGRRFAELTLYMLFPRHDATEPYAWRRNRHFSDVVDLCSAAVDSTSTGDTILPDREVPPAM